MPRVTQKGQVTIPQPIRALLDIKAGDKVDFKLVAGKVVIEKETKSAHNLQKYIGYLSHLKGQNSDDIVAELRGK